MGLTEWAVGLPEHGKARSHPRGGCTQHGVAASGPSAKHWVLSPVIHALDMPWDCAPRLHTTAQEVSLQHTVHTPTHPGAVLHTRAFQVEGLSFLQYKKRAKVCLIEGTTSNGEEKTEKLMPSQRSLVNPLCPREGEGQRGRTRLLEGSARVLSSMRERVRVHFLKQPPQWPEYLRFGQTHGRDFAELKRTQT